MSRLEQEDVQTSHDANLFDDDMEDYAVFQTPIQSNHMEWNLTGMTRMDKREASHMDLDNATGHLPTESDKRERLKTVSDKRHIKEVDYSVELRKTVYSQMEQINKMRYEMEKEAQNLQQQHMHNMEEMRKQWEAAQREWEAQLTKEFEIAQDADFIVHEAASHQDVYSYECKDGPGPDLNNLTFDLKNGSKTPWNHRIIDLLLEEIQKRCDEERWPFQRSEAYFREILHDHYKRLHMIWTAAQPKITAKGTLETPTELEQRLIVKKDKTLKATRQTTRRRNKYCHRVAVVDHLVEQAANQNEEDLPAWQLLQRLVEILGEGGMSLEESDIENDIETVLHVKDMAMNDELNSTNHRAQETIDQKSKA
ncbi:hypothetical protein BDR04DRAFT_1163057 [Suillus decipiens]|nr:hypothetical protein BDR04DRAFT_1163057 [Suillus decipiens]